MDPRFIRRDPNNPDKIICWHIYAEACELIGQENMDKLNQAGLTVVPADDSFKEFVSMNRIEATAHETVRLLTQMDLTVAEADRVLHLARHLIRHTRLIIGLQNLFQVLDSGCDFSQGASGPGK